MKKCLLVLLVITTLLFVVSCKKATPEAADDPTPTIAPVATPSPTPTPTPAPTPTPEPVFREIREIGPIVSWSTIKPDDPDLTKEQKTYFQCIATKPYRGVSMYSDLCTYFDVYKNIIQFINVTAFVIKPLGKIDNEHAWLVSMGDFERSDNDYDIVIIPDDISEIGNLLIVKSSRAISNIIPGYEINFEGSCREIIPYEIDGKIYELPVIGIDSHTRSVWGGDLSNYISTDVIKAAAEVVFGDITLVDIGYGTPEFIEGLGEVAYISQGVRINRMVDTAFEYFAFERWRAPISPRSSWEMPREFYPSTDFQNYFITTYNRRNETFQIAYYDRDFNELWERTFNNIDLFRKAPFDYTTELVYISANGNLHIIDINTGEDIIEPAILGEKIKVHITKDDVYLFGTGTENNIMKIDFAGNILWETSLPDVDKSYWDSWDELYFYDNVFLAILGGYLDSGSYIISTDGEVLYEIAGHQW